MKHKEKNKVLTKEALKQKEWIAGLDRTVLLEKNGWTGFQKADEKELSGLIMANLQYKPRTENLEKNASFKQLIPYFLIRKNGRYFTSKRKNGGGDTRIHGSRLIGFGGHLRKEDIRGKMKHWLKREFTEECLTEKILDVTFLGIVNDDGDSQGGIGKVHFGLVFVMDVSGKVALKEKDRFETGRFMTVKELKNRTPEMESWSRLIAESLENHSAEFI